MNAFKTYQEFESFVPKKVEGRKEEYRKKQEEKLRPFMTMLNKMLTELSIPLNSIDDVEERITATNKKVTSIKMNVNQIGKSNYEEFFKVTITDASTMTDTSKKFRINIRKELDGIESLISNNIYVNLASFEFAEDGTILNRRLN